MISLYPFHIYISFPYSHIPIFPYSSISIYFSYSCIDISIGSAGCPATCVFFIFSFCGMKAGCVFLVVFWCRYCGWFSSRFSSRFSFRFSVRSSPRLSFRFSLRSASRSVFRSAFRPVSHVSLLAPPFGPPHRFVSPFGRVGWAVCWSRRFCQLVWGWQAFIFLSCFGAVGAMCRHVVSLMGAVRKMAWRGVYAGRGACRLARRWAGRDGRLMAKWVLCVARSLFSCRLSGCDGEAIDVPFLSARLGGLSGDDSGVPWAWR